MRFRLRTDRDPGAPPRSGRVLGPALLGLLLLFPAGGGATEITAGGPPARVRLDTVVSPQERVVCTGRRFLDASSDSLIFLGRTLERGRDYTFDAVQGCFFLDLELFADSLSWPAGLVAFYRPLPASLEPVYAHRDLLGGVPAADPHPRAGPDTTGTAFPVRPATAVPGGGGARPELDLSGSKTFTFELGSNRDLTLRQTLDLRVAGKLSDDVKLRAILSDRNLPFQPEGNTAELEELDKVLIEVESPGARVGLGDQDLSVAGGTLGSFSRRLQGLSAEAGPADRRAKVVAASQRGEFKSFEFLGSDGKQGPYPLSDRAGGRGIVIVAGSERVWLDGVEMARGLDRDYTIDYGRAELTFSPRRVITADSRVAVDYEFSAVGYRRSLYLAQGVSGDRNAPVHVAFELAREADDNSRPVSGDLSDAERARLAAAGDSLITGGSGIRLVGEGLGRYTLAFDADNSRSYYRFAGRGLGNYEVTFVRIGAGLADYADSLAGVDTVYVYRGPNLGEYAPAGGLTQPVSLGSGHVSAAVRLGDRGRVTGEFALSGRDLNTLSSRDDDDNDGSAGVLDMTFQPRENIDLSARLRNLGRNFATLGRIDDAFSYDREWNLPGRDRPLAESRRDASAAWRPAWGVSLGAEAGGLSGGGRSADRRLVRLDRDGATFFSGSVLRVTSAVDSTDHDGRLEREAARAGTRLHRVAPVAYYEREERTAPDTGAGTRYRLGGGDLNFGAFGPLTFSVGVEGRDNDSRAADAGTWNTVSRAVTRRGSFQWAGGGALSMSGVLQARDVTTPGGGTSRTDLATLDVTQRSRNNAFVTDFHYRVATTGVETRSRTLRFVGEGRGSYDQFGNLFPGGGYELEEGALGAEELTTDLDVSLRVEMTPYRAPREGRGALAWASRNLGWDGTFRVEEQGRLPLGRPGTLFDFSSYQNPASTIRGRIQVRQTLELFPLSRTAVIRLRHDLDDVANYQFTNFREDRTEHLGGAALRSTPVNTVTLELEQRAGIRRQSVAFQASEDGRKADVYETRLNATVRPVPAARLALETTYRSERTGAAVGARSVDVNPRVSWIPTAKGRLDLNVRWITAERRGGYTGIGGFSSLFLQDRVDVTLNGDYRVTPSITIGAGLSGRKFEGTDTVIDGRTEVRAYF